MRFKKEDKIGLFKIITYTAKYVRSHFGINLGNVMAVGTHGPLSSSVALKTYNYLTRLIQGNRGLSDKQIAALQRVFDETREALAADPNISPTEIISFNPSKTSSNETPSKATAMQVGPLASPIVASSIPTTQDPYSNRNSTGISLGISLDGTPLEAKTGAPLASEQATAPSPPPKAFGASKSTEAPEEEEEEEIDESPDKEA